MSNQPPFTITPTILDRVSTISEKIGELKHDLNNPSPQLRKQNRIKTITGTLAIEGNTLTEAQVSAILEGKRVLATVKELAEVKGAIQAYEQLTTFNPYSVDDLLKAHHLMMTEIMNDAGTFRQKSVGIYKGKEVVHIAPQASRVSGLIATLFDWAKNSDYHPLIVSSVFHYELEFIHPFTDGNGRMGRLWQTRMLYQWKPLFASLPLESVIKEHQQAYYDALAIADDQADSSHFIEFMLEAIEQTLVQNAPVNASANAPVNLQALKTNKAVIELIKLDKYITRKQMAERIGKDMRTIARAIKQLQTTGQLTRVGSDKTGYWKLL